MSEGLHAKPDTESSKHDRYQPQTVFRNSPFVLLRSSFVSAHHSKTAQIDQHQINSNTHVSHPLYKKAALLESGSM